MRFVLAIAAFVVAAAMIALGIAQRTVLLEASSVSMSARVTDEAPYAVIDSATLRSHPGAQTVTVSGAPTTFLALGRTADVAAWIGDETSSTIGYDAKKRTLVVSTDAATTAPTSTPTATPTPATPATPAPTADAAPASANPEGSDLWLDEYTGKKSLTAQVNVPDGYALLVASDGTKPAPTSVRITWPLDNSTPWAGPLILGGIILLVVGLISYIWAILHLRRSRRPRRNMPKGPRRPRLPRAPRPKTIKEVTASPDKRALGRAPRLAVLPVALIGALALSGCSADFWPGAAPSTAPAASASASPTTTADPTGEALKPPAVTVPQLERIVRKIAVVAADSDAKLDLDTLKTRFAGPALELREANYKVRSTLAEYPAPDAIPAAPVELTVPQQTDSWPRVVMTVIQNKDDPTTKPTALVLSQAGPRENYVVRYAVALAADATVPGMAPASIGSPIVAPDSEFLLLPPNQVATAYADVMMNGDKSQYYPLFDTEHDAFLPQVGVAYKDKRRAELPATASIEFTNAPGKGRTISLATNDNGALVTANINETETVRPTDGGTVSPQNAAKAYSGVENSTKGVTQTFGDQLLFYVPPTGSTEKITLLGFAQGLTSAAEAP
ncbi:hypothetical protein WDJ51_05840 [Rathayibacter sp. YIM 133350]|uniref:hypothetical protein n=1 Tax=Rathayibacter sp. YIM 133350 TaxID=3131992 RepID=UPI00307F8396